MRSAISSRTACDDGVSDEAADWLAPQLLARMGEDAVHGVHWHLSRPPIIGLDFEMDLRGIAYTGVDIVPEMILQNTERYGGPGISFHVLDITSDAIPRADLILCRDCLVHLSFRNIKKTLDRFLESGSRYLACTSFVQNRFNYDIRDGDWRTLNMQKAPFSFPAPLEVIPDDCALGDGAFADKSLCIWSLDDIGKRSSKNAVHP